MHTFTMTSGTNSTTVVGHVFSFGVTVASGGGKSPGPAMLDLMAGGALGLGI